MDATPQTFHLVVDSAQKASSFIAEQTPFSKQQIKTFMHKGAVWLSRAKSNRRLRRETYALLPGDQIYLYYNEAVLSQVPLQASCIADEGDYSIWYKPAGMFSQGSKWGDHCAISRYVELHLQPQRPTFLVHRLDRATSGLIIIAHSKTAAKKLSAAFEQRAIDKHYLAIVRGDFSSQASPVTVTLALEGKQACSHFTFKDFAPAAMLSLLDVAIETGRKHQIRQHLAAIGFPIVGDRLYGESDSQADLQLCAYQLKFICPISQQQRSYRLQKSQTLDLNQLAQQLQA